MDHQKAVEEGANVVLMPNVLMTQVVRTKIIYITVSVNRVFKEMEKCAKGVSF